MDSTTTPNVQNPTKPEDAAKKQPQAKKTFGQMFMNFLMMGGFIVILILAVVVIILVERFFK